MLESCDGASLAVDKENHCMAEPACDMSGITEDTDPVSNEILAGVPITKYGRDAVMMMCSSVTREKAG